MKKIAKISASVLALLLVCVGAVCFTGCISNKENKGEDLVIGGLTFKQISITIPTKTYNAQKLVSNAYVDDYTKSCAMVSIEYEISNNTGNIQALKPNLFKRDVQLFDNSWTDSQYKKEISYASEIYKNRNNTNMFYTVEYVSIDYYYNPYTESYINSIEGNYSQEEIHNPIIIVPGETAKFEIYFGIIYSQGDELLWSNEEDREVLKQAFEQITFSISYNNVNLASGNFTNFE